MGGHRVIGVCLASQSAPEEHNQEQKAHIPTPPPIPHHHHPSPPPIPTLTTHPPPPKNERQQSLLWCHYECLFVNKLSSEISETVLFDCTHRKFSL